MAVINPAFLELVDESWQWGMRGTEPALTLDVVAAAAAPHAWRPEQRNWWENQLPFFAGKSMFAPGENCLDQQERKK